MVELALRNVVYARVNWSRWIADCPSPFCLSALQLHPGEKLFRCMDCDVEGEVIWPDIAVGIERLLMMRPDPFTRNWEPGESLHDLAAENAEHGVDMMPTGEIPNGSTLLEISDDTIRVDRLPLPAGRRLQIGR